MVGIWSVASGIIMLSLFYAAVSVYSIIANLRSRVWVSTDADTDIMELPKVTILLPFYKEELEHIDTTFKSIVFQSYPRNLMEVYVIVEKDDVKTLTYVSELKKYLEMSNIEVHVVVSNNERKSKAAAINSVLGRISGDIIIIYDAGDVVTDNHHVAKVVKLINSGYSVVGCKVYRSSKGVLGTLSLIDTVLWYNVSLPGLTFITKYPLVSGEGLALSKEFLKMINGLPDKLTEDSYITILAAKHGCRIALLDTIIYEGAPKNIRGLTKQRLRWYRGYVECLMDLLTTHRRELDTITILKLTIIYAQPLALLSLPIAIAVLISSTVVAVDQLTLALSVTALLMMILAPLYVLYQLRIKDVSTFLTPTYWIFQGAIVAASLLPVRIGWLRTERNYTVTSFNHSSNRKSRT